jgi:hypothetical protein
VEGKGIDLPATSATAGALLGAIQEGWAQDDFASLARHYAYPGSVKQPVVSKTVSEKQDKSVAASGDDGSAPKKKGLFGLFAPKADRS